MAHRVRRPLCERRQRCRIAEIHHQPGRFIVTRRFHQAVLSNGQLTIDNFRSACTSDNKGISFYPTVTHGLMKCRCLDASGLRTAAFVFIRHLGEIEPSMDWTGRWIVPGDPTGRPYIWGELTVATKTVNKWGFQTSFRHFSSDKSPLQTIFSRIRTLFNHFSSDKGLCHSL